MMGEVVAEVGLARVAVAVVAAAAVVAVVATEVAMEKGAEAAGAPGAGRSRHSRCPACKLEMGTTLLITQILSSWDNNMKIPIPNTPALHNNSSPYSRCIR